MFVSIIFCVVLQCSVRHAGGWNCPKLMHTSKYIQILVMVRYMSVIWFAFHVLQLLLIVFTQQNSCCISKSTMKYVQNRIENRAFLDLVMIITSASLLVY